MKPLLLISIGILATGSAIGQNIINSTQFFDPDIRARRTGSSSLISLTVNNTPVTNNNSGVGGWSLSAGGHAQAGVNGAPIANVDVQLAAFTQTAGDSLVFGREIVTTVETLLGGNLGSVVNPVVNSVVGANVDYSWAATKKVTGLAIVPDQLYQVDFKVTSGSGLPVDLISSASFGITTAGISGTSQQSATLLNLLNLVSFQSSNPTTGEFSFVFQSDQARSELDFAFAAQSLANVKFLGGTQNANQNVLTFSDFQVNAIPEPSSMAVFGAFVTLATLRRRRNS